MPKYNWALKKYIYIYIYISKYSGLVVVANVIVAFTLCLVEKKINLCKNTR